MGLEAKLRATSQISHCETIWRKVFCPHWRELQQERTEIQFSCTGTPAHALQPVLSQKKSIIHVFYCLMTAEWKSKSKAEMICLLRLKPIWNEGSHYHSFLSFSRSKGLPAPCQVHMPRLTSARLSNSRCYLFTRTTRERSQLLLQANTSNPPAAFYSNESLPPKKKFAFIYKTTRMLSLAR